MGYTNIRIQYGEVVQRRRVQTYCQKCKKKLLRVLRLGYFKNGLHDYAVTHAKNEKWLDKESKRMQKQGVVCHKCEGE